MTSWEILARLWRLQRAVFADAAPCRERHGLAPAALFVLAHVQARPAPSQLARTLGLPLPTMSHILRRLERQGLIRRQADPQDLRRFRLSLTDAGLAALAAARDCAGRALEARLARLSARERDELARLLDVMLTDDEEVRRG